jgi:hypothetical protein
MKKAFGIFLVALAAFSSFGLAMPSEWDFGSRSDEKPIKGSLLIGNDEDFPLSIRLIPSCNCLAINPDSLALKSGESATVRIVFDPTGYAGHVDKAILVRVKDGVDRMVAVKGDVKATKPPVPDYPGECEWCKKQSEEIRRRAYESWRNRPGVIHYYYSQDCASCAEFLKTEVPRLAKAMGMKIEVDSLDIRVAGVLSELDGILSKKLISLEAFPVLLVGDTVLQGEKEIRKKAKTALKKLAAETGK